MKTTKLFITGLGGTAGRALAELAVSNNYLVGGTIYQNFPQELKDIADKGSIKCYRINLKNSDDITKAIADFQPNVVVHLAGKVLGGSDKKVFDRSIYEENILIFKNILNALKQLNPLPRFILSSGCLIYDKQVSPDFITEIPVWNLPEIDSTTQPYRASKADQEKILSQENNLYYIIARPTQFTGSGKIPGVIEWYIATEILKIKAGKIKSVSVRNKLGEVDILDTRDVAKAFLTLIAKGTKGEIYHINSGSPTTVENVAKILLEISGLNPSRFRIVSTDAERTTYFRFSPQKLNKLGWVPQFSLKDALTTYWEYFKNQEKYK